MAWVIDLDGVMWLGEHPIPGSADAVRRLRDAGQEVVFVTNNSAEVVSDVEAKLAAHGVEASGAVVTSALAAATLVEPGGHAFACAGPGVVEALRARGVSVLEPGTDPAGSVDVVVVGFTRRFDFDLLAVASRLVREGARFVATNSDPTYPTPDGLLPGGGSIVAAVAAASGVEPEFAGKPFAPMVDLVRSRLGPEGVVVGDRTDTDGRFAAALGYRFALVGTGVTAPEGFVDPPPALRAADLAAVVDRLG